MIKLQSNPYFQLWESWGFCRLDDKATYIWVAECLYREMEQNLNDRVLNIFYEGDFMVLQSSSDAWATQPKGIKDIPNLEELFKLQEKQ